MRSILALASKDLKLLYRDRFGLFWVVMFPLLMALFFGSIFSSNEGGSRALKVAYIGTGDSARVASLGERLASSSALSVQSMSLDSARGLVAAGKLVAYVHYTDTASGTFGMFGDERPSLEVGIDPARKAEAGYLKGLITQAYFSRMQDVLKPETFRSALDTQLPRIDSSTTLSGEQKGLFKGFLSQLSGFLSTLDSADTGGNATSSPFSEPDMEFRDVAVDREGPRSSWEITFPQSLQWALIGVAAAFAVSLVMERTRGTFMRLRLAPISRLQILAGKGLACFIASVSSAALLLSIGVFVFGVRISSPLGIVVAVLSAAFCFVGIMMFISVLGKTEQAVGGAGWAMLLVMSMTGGGMVPLMFMPSWLARLGNFSPIKWSILAMEGAVWRGFTWAQMATPIAVLLGVGAAGLAIGTFVLSRSDG